MDTNQMIEDLVKMLDSGMAGGVGHVNVDVDETQEDGARSVETMGCVDCSKNAFACSIPTLDQGDGELQ